MQLFYIEGINFGKSGHKNTPDIDNSKLGSGRATLRLRSTGPATVEEEVISNFQRFFFPHSFKLACFTSLHLLEKTFHFFSFLCLATLSHHSTFPIFVNYSIVMFGDLKLSANMFVSFYNAIKLVESSKRLPIILSYSYLYGRSMLRKKSMTCWKVSLESEMQN